MDGSSDKVVGISLPDGVGSGKGFWGDTRGSWGPSNTVGCSFGTLGLRIPSCWKWVLLILPISFPSLRRSFLIRKPVVLTALLLGAGGFLLAETPGSGLPASALPVASDPVVMQAMSTELDRAMAQLGTPTTPAVESKSGAPLLKPYFLSYSVADAENVSISAQYGAIVSSNAGHSRTADVQVRLGSAALDNTHGDHRTSALTTMALPLGDDRDAIERTLWYAKPIRRE